ncbi:hypothetical protein NDU88_006853 [Pleurodeles waltl]|uniref:CCHC-type domain-containing protein n=1 Tax=Pleurodeles waltl TaxID=8319 RepID=A0AAV7WFZ9_PLEWA|nr:hypothetical protein NDU88_006853 [Pleurodeles waltl]
MERYYFGKREQGKDESVEEFITSLRKLAASCKFGTLVDERIRDQFVLKCSSDKIREELWLKDEPPLEEVIMVAKRVEHMLKCVLELSGNKVPSGEGVKVEEIVCEVKSKECGEKKKCEDVLKFKGECFRCGKSGHKANASNCPALNVVCNGCGSKGHFYKCCRNRKKTNYNSNLMKEDNEISQEVVLQVEARVKLVDEGVKDGEQKDPTVLEENVCEIISDVCEITSGAITEQEWEEALKDDVEISVLLNIEREKCDVLVILVPRDPHGDGMWNVGIAERTVGGEDDGWGDYD